MTEKERVTVDLDAECYYLDGEYWESWDNYGEEMADEINKLLNEQEERIKQLETELSDMTQRFGYELKMKLKYHSKLIECEKKGDVE